jgi:predicted nucleotidyltransferase
LNPNNLDTALREAANSLINYSKSNPDILRVWLFGSRIGGEPRPDSDLDVAMELDRRAMPQDWSPFETWAAEHEKFQSEIQPLLKLLLHHAHFYHGQTIGREMEEALEEGCLIFSR